MTQQRSIVIVQNFIFYTPYMAQKKIRSENLYSTGNGRTSIKKEVKSTMKLTAKNYSIIFFDDGTRN